jgi:hypothetical protein
VIHERIYFSTHLECPLATLSLARRVHIYIYIQTRKKPNTKNNERNMEKSNRGYVYARYHIRRKGQKERKERKKKNMEWKHPYMRTE